MNGKQYQQTIDFLFDQLPMFQRIGPAAFKKDLTNIIALCDHLGQPQDKFPCIHIAGTNGKGSSAHFLAAIFQAAGYRTGLYTSPHYKDFRERIKIDGKMMHKKEVINFCRRHRAFFEQLQPSFFEITVAMAFDTFANRKVDIAIIETGLGGRLDSTNIVDPELTLITNISFDHQAFLGNTLREIAGEKAGIIKPEIPVVISERQPEVEDVFLNLAKAKKSPLVFASDHFVVQPVEQHLTHTVFDVFHDGKPYLKGLKVDVFGDIQARNLAGVLQSCQLMWDMGCFLGEAVIRKGLANLRKLTNYMGRWQILAEDPLTICDSGHNASGWEQVMRHLAKMNYQNLHMVLGTVNDKPPDKLISLLPKSANYYLARPDVPRGLSEQVLLEHAVAAGLKAKAYPTVKLALAAARKNAGPDDLIFVGGSTFVVAEVL